MAKKAKKKPAKQVSKQTIKPIQTKQDHHGTRNFLLALIVIIGIIILFLIILNLPETKEVPPTIIKQEQTQETKPKEQQTIIQTTKGKITSDFNKQNILNEIKTCTDKIEEETQFTKQFTEAITTKDPTKCKGFETFCQAKINKNTNICNTLEEKEFCQAIILEEQTLCKQDKTCLAFTTHNKIHCSELENTFKLSCELMATKDLKEFEKQKSLLNINCSDTTYKKYAFLYEMPQLCDSIIYEDVKQECQKTTY